MTLTHVEATPQPMIQHTARVSMDPSDIEKVMTSAFEALGRFMVEAQVTPVGPPLAIYSDWSDDQMRVDVGFPVTAADASKVKGDIHAGSTPGGYAVKVVHRGAYDSLRDTYAVVEAEMASAGLSQSGLAWEVYLGEPGVTPEAELVTEIYMQVRPEDAAKLPAGS